jgi:DNA recombination protein RmuC
MDTNIIYTILGLLLVGVITLLVLIYLKLNKSGDNNESIADEVFELNTKLGEQLKYLKDELRHTANNIDHKLHEHQRDMNTNVKDQFSESQKLIGQITKELTEVKEGNKQVFSMTEQLSNLEKVLTNQKQRGNWGESSLELILSNIINGNYAMQHYFENGEAVDAVVRIKDKFLPIDSKFSLDNYQRCIDAENEEERKYYAEEFKKDLKLRITETAKYIREKENTLPIAFMFIPSEAIYYDLLAGENSRLKINTQKLVEYAQNQKVFIVSPTSILAYLHLVLSGIKAFTIEEGAKQIQKRVEELSKHIDAYEEYYKKLGNTLTTTVNHYNTGYKELKKIDKDVYKITEGVSGGNMETLAIDKPRLNEDED